MITLDDFSDWQNKKKSVTKIVIKNMSKKEWNWEDLPEEINSLSKVKKYIEKVKKNSELSNHFGAVINIIEHGSPDLYKHNGKKKVLIAEGIKPYTAIYLMFELYRGIERWQIDLAKNY